MLMQSNLFHRLRLGMTSTVITVTALAGLGALAPAGAAVASPASTQVTLPPLPCTLPIPQPPNPIGQPPPPPPPPPPPCYVAAGFGLVKEANTASGSIETFLETWDPAKAQYVRSIDATSDFPVSDARDGTFSLILGPGATASPELGYVKTTGTSSGSVEVHVDTRAPSGSYTRALDATSDFSPSLAGSGIFLLFGDVNGEPELGFVKTANTTSGTVEAFVDVWNGSSYVRIINATSDFTIADAANGTFDLLASPAAPAGNADLVFIKERNTAGSIEVHTDELNNGRYTRLFDATSDLPSSDAGEGTFQAYDEPDGIHLGFMQTAGVSSVTLSAESMVNGSYQWKVGAADFSPSDATAGEVSLVGADAF
jgi:hypothetical protein